MNLTKLINASGFVPGTPHVSYYLTVYNNEKQLRNFRLEVKY